MNHGNWKRGKPIPKKYRNKLYAWEGGGYDGCFWEMNQGVVTDEGHWDPFHSTGRNGLDQDDWHEARIRHVKRCHGFQADEYHGGCGEDVAAWFSTLSYDIRQEAMKKYYGEHPYDNPDYFDESKPSGERHVDRYHAEVEAYVAERIAPHRERYDAYLADRRKVDEEWHALLDEMFMDQIKAQEERGPNVHSWDYHGPARDRWEVYPLDEESVKASCERFCREYASTVGVMCGVLDALAERGYDVWCTCSDCGKQFQLSDYEKFSHLIDENAYHGDGGIGCIFTRVQCEECHSDTECPKCFEPNLPTRKDVESGHAYDHYSFQEQFVAQWIGVCDCCAYNFLAKDEYRHWRDDIDELETAINGGIHQLREYLDLMKESGKPKEELDRLKAENIAAMSKEWAELTNDLRRKMQEDVEAHFSDCADWANQEMTPKEAEGYV